jgi:hypothetical protein
MKLAKALVVKKERVIRKNGLEARLVEAMQYKIHLESKETMELLYSKEDFEKMMVEVEMLRQEIEALKKRISIGNQQKVAGHDKTVQELILEIGSLKDYLAMLGQLRGKCQEDRYGRQEGVATKTMIPPAILDADIDAAQGRINLLNAEITEMNSLIDV